MICIGNAQCGIHIEVDAAQTSWSVKYGCRLTRRMTQVLHCRGTVDYGVYTYE